MSPETISTIILLGSFLLLVFLRFPIAYSVGISTVLCLLSMGQNLSVLPMQVVNSTVCARTNCSSRQTPG